MDKLCNITLRGPRPERVPEVEDVAADGDDWTEDTELPVVLERVLETGDEDEPDNAEALDEDVEPLEGAVDADEPDEAEGVEAEVVEVDVADDSDAEDSLDDPPEGVMLELPGDEEADEAAATPALPEELGAAVAEDGIDEVPDVVPGGVPNGLPEAGLVELDEVLDKPEVGDPEDPLEATPELVPDDDAELAV